MENKQAASRGPGLTPKPQSSIYPHSHSRAAAQLSAPGQQKQNSFSERTSQGLHPERARCLVSLDGRINAVWIRAPPGKLLGSKAPVSPRDSNPAAQQSPVMEHQNPHPLRTGCCGLFPLVL